MRTLWFSLHSTWCNGPDSQPDAAAGSVSNLSLVAERRKIPSTFYQEFDRQAWMGSFFKLIQTAIPNAPYIIDTHTDPHPKHFGI